MLVLSRKRGEAIQLHLKDGRVVDVTVTDVVFRHGQPCRVKLGITAPDDVLILREEVPMGDAIRVFTGAKK